MDLYNHRYEGSLTLCFSKSNFRSDVKISRSVDPIGSRKRNVGQVTLKYIAFQKMYKFSAVTKYCPRNTTVCSGPYIYVIYMFAEILNLGGKVYIKLYTHIYNIFSQT